MAGSDVVLYHGMASTCSKKVRLCLYEKGIAFESHLLDLQKFEQHRPDYLALNPNGVVPTLVHRDRPIIESSVIIEYLDDAFLEVPLKPADTYARAQMRLWLKYSDEVAYKAVYAPTWQFLRKRAEAGLSEEARRATLAAIPTAERRERWEKMAQGGFTPEDLKEAYGKMRKCLTGSGAGGGARTLARRSELFPGRYRDPSLHRPHPQLAPGIDDRGGISALERLVPAHGGTARLRAGHALPRRPARRRTA